MTGLITDLVTEPDARRSARLLFAAELAEGRVSEGEVMSRPEVFTATRPSSVPTLPRRIRQALDRRSGRLDPEHRIAGPAVAARRAVLGDASVRAPRFLLRMDEYPHWLAQRRPERYNDRAFSPWHEILRERACAHLVAVVPRIAEDPEARRGGSRDLLDEEVARLRQLAADGVELGLHGYEHRTRFRHPRLHTELGQRSRREVAGLLDEAADRLEDQVGVRARVLVPPFNTFDARQYPELAARFRVVTGGPESILRMGFQTTPAFREGAVYLPCYPPLYGTAAEVRPAVERALQAGTGLWTPVVLHWGWEADRGWKDLEHLIDLISPHAARWDDFLTTVELSA